MGLGTARSFLALSIVSIDPRITLRMAKTPPGRPQRTVVQIPSITGGEIETGMRICTDRLMTRRGGSRPTSPSCRSCRDAADAKGSNTPALAAEVIPRQTCSVTTPRELVAWWISVTPTSLTMASLGLTVVSMLFVAMKYSLWPKSK